MILQIGLLTGGFMATMYLSKKCMDMKEEDYLCYALSFTMLSAGLVVLNEVFKKPSE